MKQQLLPKDLLREARKVEDVEAAVVEVFKKKEEPPPRDALDPFGSFRFPPNMGETQRAILDHEQRHLEEIRHQTMIAAQQVPINSAYLSAPYWSIDDSGLI